MPHKMGEIPENIADILEEEYNALKAENEKTWTGSFQRWNFFSDEKQRRDFIVLVRRLGSKLRSSPDRQKILYAALAYEYVETSPGLLAETVTNGSMMYRAIKGPRVLNIFADKDKSNLLSDEELRAHLENFYQYIKANIDDADLRDLYWVSKKALLEAVARKIGVVQTRIENKFQRMKNALPDPDGLLEEQASSIKSYRAVNNARKNNSCFNPSQYNKERERCCRIFELIARTAKDAHPYDKTIFHPDTPEKDIPNITHGFQLKSIVAGAQLLVYKSINDSAWFKNNSYLCYFGLQGLNQEDINSIPDLEKVIYFNMLQTHLITLQNNSIIFESIRKEWEELNMDGFVKQLEDMRSKIIIEAQTPGKTQWILSRTLGWGAAILTMRLATQCVGPMVWEALPVVVAGVPGLVIIAAVASTVFVIPLIYNTVCPLTAHLFASGVEAAGDQLGAAATKLISGIKHTDLTPIQMDSRYMSPENMQVLTNLLKAWLESDFISKEDKAQLRKVKHLHVGKEEEELPTVRWIGQPTLVKSALLKR